MHNGCALRLRQNGWDFADNILKCIFLGEIVEFSIKISLKCVPKGPIDNIPALVQIIAWRRPGDKPLSELMMVSLLTHISVTRPQWVKQNVPPLLTWWKLFPFNWHTKAMYLMDSKSWYMMTLVASGLGESSPVTGYNLWPVSGSLPCSQVICSLLLIKGRSVRW